MDLSAGRKDSECSTSSGVAGDKPTSHSRRAAGDLDDVSGRKECAECRQVGGPAGLMPTPAEAHLRRALKPADSQLTPPSHHGAIVKTCRQAIDVRHSETGAEMHVTEEAIGPLTR